MRIPECNLRRLYELEEAVARARAEIVRQLQRGDEPFHDSDFTVHEAALVAPMQRSILSLEASAGVEVDIRIMRRLLSDADIEWLKAQGVKHKYIARLRRQRRALFSQWLRILRAESRAQLRRQKELALTGDGEFDRLLRNHIAISKDLCMLSFCAGLHALGFSFVNGFALRWLRDIERRLIDPLRGLRPPSLIEAD